MRANLFLLSTLISQAIAAKISVGQQQSGGKNYHIVWWEGETPCDGLGHILGSVDQSLCSFNFQLQNQGSICENCSLELLANSELTTIVDHFAYCGTNDLAIYRLDGSLYGKCSSKDYNKKLTCQDTHDVIKHYVCG
ncbi:hypothetical protein FPANT_2980 [Fusarium pseudoanthophilum]|uniref:Cyanovirin-N domain-containing protein n=1 Tax=Fusarium pseudoanthophilum TaxID=48495 RepID=A0A8H5PMM3_9HYPO|nr:hypothetical protein FPANT_2980 [Fusarium pseudoanthophilum]